MEVSQKACFKPFARGDGEAVALLGVTGVSNPDWCQDNPEYGNEPNSRKEEHPRSGNQRMWS